MGADLFFVNSRDHIVGAVRHARSSNQRAARVCSGRWSGKLRYEPCGGLPAKSVSTAAAFSRSTRSIPIVFTVVTDPVGAGYVETLARPGGNATGFMANEYSLYAKYPELLKEIAPGIARVAVLRDPSQGASTGDFAVIEAMAPLLRVQVTPINLREAGEIDTHLMIPAEYEWRRHCVTSLGWHDPRGLDEKDEPLIAIQPDGARVPRDSAAQVELDQREGALMWPERFGPQEIARIKAELGPALSSGRLQQSPSPAKGGLFLREWWELYESPDGKFPPFEHVVASLDSAFTAKEQNDPSALTIWGVFSLPPTMVSRPPMGALPNSWAGEVRADKRQRVQEMPEGWSANVGKSREHRRIMLIHAWRKHLPFSGPRIEKIPGETSNMFKRRTSESWGLLEWVEDTCTRFKIDKLLIEAKASGISAAQELRNRYGFQGWSIETRPVRGDKVARALAVQPMFSQGMIYAPNRDWAELVMSEMAMFPAGRFDDLTDSATQALKYLRDRGWGQTDNEERQAEIGTVMHRPRLGRLYPC